MTHPKTDEEKIQFVKDLINNALDAAAEESDKIMEQIEKEWLAEIDTSKDKLSKVGN